MRRYCMGWPIGPQPTRSDFKAINQITSVANNHRLANLNHGGLLKSPLTIRVLLVVGLLRNDRFG